MNEFKNNPCNGGNNPKEITTVLLACNADGTHKFPPLVVRNSVKICQKFGQK
jgi:hypothetical protein